MSNFAPSIAECTIVRALLACRLPFFATRRIAGTQVMVQDSLSAGGSGMIFVGKQ